MRKGKGGEGIEEKKKKPMRVTFPFFFRMGDFPFYDLQMFNFGQGKIR